MKNESNRLINLNRIGWLVVINLSIVSFLSDFIYEGSRSILGQYFLLLNIPIFYLGIVVGFSEFIGYFIRYFVGSFIDKFSSFRFLFIYLGYFFNLLSVPLLYFANNFYFILVLVFLERFGKGLRIPPRDAVFSIVSNKCNIESAKIFGIHHLVDQLGAFVGPGFLSIVFFYFQFNDVYHYKLAFLILGIPIIFVFLLLILTNIYFNKIFYYIYHLENSSKNKVQFNNINDSQFNDRKSSIELNEVNKLNSSDKNSRYSYLILVIFSMLVAFGYIDLPIILYHFKSIYGFNNDYLAIICYSLAMVSSAIGGFISSSLFKKSPFFVIIFSLILVIFYPLILVIFYKNIFVFLLVSVFWGWALGTFETTFKILISIFSNEQNVGKMFGMFHTLFGLSWFIGSSFLTFFSQYFEFNFVYFISFIIEIIAFLFFLVFKNKIIVIK